MVSKKKVRQQIDRAEINFLRCWDTLSQIKMGTWDKSSLDSFLQFQYELAKTLFELAEFYNSISNEKRDVINRKRSLSENWFNNRLKTLDSYLEALKITISIGKSLGDSFAWLFYNKDRDFLHKHLMEEKIFSTSTGIGGIGELEYIKNIKGLGGYFVLFHGITSFLRIGDISLVDLREQKIIAIGEIKSTEHKPGFVQITTIFGGPEFIKEMYKENPVEKETPIKIQLPPKMESRLKRQLTKISSSFEESKYPSLPPSTKVLDNLYIKELDSLGKNLRVGKVSTRLAGESLLLIGYKQRKSKLSSRIVGPEINWQEKLKDVQNIAGKIVHKNEKDNRVFISSLHYSKNSNPYLLMGMTPLFWWPLDLNLIKGIFFYRVYLLTLFNQAFLLEKLRGKGFDINLDENQKLNRLSRVIGDRKFSIERAGYFLNLIQSNLFTEEAIIELIENFFTDIAKGNLPDYAQVNIQVLQKFI